MAVYDFVTSNGTIIVDTAQIKRDVEQEWLSLPNVDVIPDPSSFEGRLLDAEISSRVSVARNNAKMANLQSPNQAYGVSVDGHLALVGSEREGKTRSTVTLTLTGVTGTYIPALSNAQDVVTKKIWQLISPVTIPANGAVDAVFQAVEYGPVTAAAGDITKIVPGVLGWETVNNTGQATLGRLEQTDASAKRQRLEQIGKNSRTNAHSILAAISAVEGVVGVKFRENYTDTQRAIDDVTMLPHSTWAVVDGGDDLAIAEAYYQARTGGAAFSGSDVTQPTTDSESGQSIPVKFDRPDLIPLICKVTARQKSTVVSIDTIQQAVVDYADGKLGDELGFAVGEYASPFEIAAAINEHLPEMFITKVELTTVAPGSPTYSTDTIQNKIFEKSTITKSDVEVSLI